MIAARWLLFVSLVGMVGAVVVRCLLPSGDGAPGPEPTFERRAARAGAGCAVVGMLAMAALFIAQLLEFRDPFAPLPAEASILLATSWGHAWTLASVGVTGVAMAFAGAARLPAGSGSLAGWVFAGLLTAGLAFFPAFVGHAIATEDLTTVAVMADGAHVLAAGAWLGSLAVLVWVAVGRGTGERGRDRGFLALLPRILPRFSTLALVCAATVVVTGALAAWLHLPDIGSLFTSRYGRILLAKLGLVGGIVVLGAVNWRRVSGPEARLNGPRLRIVTAVLEVAIALAVLGATALLVGTAPPAAMP